MPDRSFKAGDKVCWNSHGGGASGKVVEVATKDGSIGDFEYKASEDDTRYIVETEDGKQAAHKASALERGLGRTRPGVERPLIALSTSDRRTVSQ